MIHFIKPTSKHQLIMIISILNADDFKYFCKITSLLLSVMLISPAVVIGFSTLLEAMEF